MYRSTLFLLASLALTGCSNFVDYFSMTASEALLIGVEELPDELDLGTPTAGLVFLAQARSLDSFAANLVDDADSVTISIGGLGVDLTNTAQGTYTVDSMDDPDLSYEPGETIELTIQQGGRTRSASLIAPGAPDLGPMEEPLVHVADADLEIDVTGDDFDNHVAMVARIGSDGSLTVTYDSRPVTAQDFIDWIRGSGSGETVVSIPGTAFPDPGATYILGIAGMRNAPKVNFSDLNPIVSNLTAGSMAGRMVVTEP
ncbi:MAG: hypothetical protein VX498_09310 [Myxococcota bacterium]|nr:hypothetical protein [Myxococcota bacterium]